MTKKDLGVVDETQAQVFAIPLPVSVVQVLDSASSKLVPAPSTSWEEGCYVKDRW